MTFQIDILSLNGSVYSGEVEEVVIPSLDGEMTILARHMPVIAPLGMGEVVVKTRDRVLNFSIGKGVVEFSGGKARLLIEDVTSADEMSEQKALDAKRKAEELLAKGIPQEVKSQALYVLRKSLVDLKIIRRIKKKMY